MKRKLVKQGNNALTVTLPSEWIKKLNLQAGNEVEVEEKDNSIIIAAEKMEGKSRIEINITGLDYSSIRHEIRAAYKLGYDEIILNFENNEAIEHKVDRKTTVIDAIHKEVDMLIGIEVFEQKENYCLLKSISESPIDEFDNILRRVFLLLNEVSNDLVKEAKIMDKKISESIAEKHDVITKFLNLCLRLLNKKGYIDYKKLTVMYHLIANLDKILDIIKYSARDLTFFKQKNLRKETINILQEIDELIVNYYNLFYKFNLELIAKFSKNRWKIIKDINSLANKLPSNELLLISNMGHCLEILLDLTEARMSLEL